MSTTEPNDEIDSFLEQYEKVNDEVDKLLANIWLDGFESRESGVVWGTEDFKSKSVEEAREAIQRLVVEKQQQTWQLIRSEMHGHEVYTWRELTLALDKAWQLLHEPLNNKQEQSNGK